MELRKGFLILLPVTFLLVQKTTAFNNTENFQIVVPEKPLTQGKPSPALNKSIDKLVQEQTDLIKKIVSSHRATTIEYPVVTKKEVEFKEDAKIKEEKERQSIDDLRKRCQELFKLSTSNNTKAVEERSETKEKIDRISTVEAFGPNQKPEFLQKQNVGVLHTTKFPSNFSNPTNVLQATKNYFFITRNQTVTTINNQTSNNTGLSQNSNFSELKKYTNPNLTQPQNPLPLMQAAQHPVHPNVKYVQLEPVILQKMILNNGRMFYWYKSMPTIPQFISVAKYQPSLLRYPPRNSEVPLYPSQDFKYPSQDFKYPSQDFKYPSQDFKYPSQVSNSQIYPPPSQTYPAQVSNSETLQTENIQAYQSNDQKYSQVSNTQTRLIENTNSGNNQQQLFNTQTSRLTNNNIQPPTQVQTAPEQVPNYEIEYGTTDKPSDNLYTKQMKFVIPMPYGSSGDQTEVARRYSWQFDPYTYYPKLVQPSTISIPITYIPTFHMIKTLRLPEQAVKTGDSKSF